MLINKVDKKQTLKKGAKIQNFNYNDIKSTY